MTRFSRSAPTAQDEERDRRRKRNTVIALALFVLAIPAAVLSVWLAHGLNKRTVNLDRLLNQTRIEMMPSDTAEWLEFHTPSLDGHDLATEVLYRDGNRGFRYFRADGTLSELVVVNPQGVELVHLNYSATGKQVVSGFEHRNDGTLRRKARLEGNTVELITYWQDGVTPFSVQYREVDKYDFRGWFYRQDGTRWAYQSGNLYATHLPIREEHLWNDQDQKVHAFDRHDLYNSYVEFHRPNGTRKYRQSIGKHQFEVCDEGGCGMVDSRALHRVEVFDEKDRLTHRIIMVDTGRSIDYVEVFDAAGNKTVVDFEKEKEPPIKFPEELTAAEPEPVDPQKLWKEAEAKVQAFTEVK